MTTPTFNKFKSTTVYGAFNNIDYPDNTVQASAFFQRALTCSGNISCSGIIYGKDGTFSGVLSAVTPETANNSTRVATTAYVKSQGYLSSASLSNYALLNGTNNWAGVNNFNVNVGALTNSFATGLSVCQNISNGQYETDFITNNGNNGGGFRFYASTNGTISTPLFEITPSATNSIVGDLAIKQRNSTNSVVLQFQTAEGYTTSLIYSSVLDNFFHFDILQAYNPNGFVWRKADTGAVLMTLDLNGKLKTAGSNTVCGVQQIIN